MRSVVDQDPAPCDAHSPATRIRVLNEAPRWLVRRAPRPSNDRHRLAGHPLADLAHTGGFERFVVGDVFYYYRKINTLFTAGLDRTLYEYPTPVVWILWLPYGASFGSRVGYLIAFVIFMLALDAVFCYALWRASGRRTPAPSTSG